MKKIFILFVSFSLLGCAIAMGPEFTEEEVSPGHSLVYVYRKAQFYGAGNMLIPRLWVGNEKVGAMKMGGYYPIHLEPGIHKLEIKSITGDLIGAQVIEIESGEVKYFEYIEVMTGMNNYGGTMVAGGKSAFVEMPEKLAMKKLLKTNNLSK